MFNAHQLGIIFPSYSPDFLTAWADRGHVGPPHLPVVVTDINRHLDLNVDGVLNSQDTNLAVSTIGYPRTAENARLVALNDNQLVFLLSLIRKTEFPEAWYMAWQDSAHTAPAYPSQTLNGYAWNRVSAWLEDLKEQLMVDVRPELNAMVAAQNEMSDDLDAIRIALEQIAADIDAADNAEKLENIANMIGLLVTLL